MTSDSLITQIQTSLQTTHHLSASPTFIATLLTTLRHPLPPLPALVSTAHFRILASDITTSLSASNNTNLFPADITTPTIKERKLPNDIVVQVLDITDVGSSKWSQIEAIERVERGEEVRGREVIRTVPIMNEDDNEQQSSGGRNVANMGGGGGGGGATSKRSQGPHKLVLQDARGTKAVGFELKEIPRCWIGEEGMGVGCKMLLKRGTLVKRGMVMLTSDMVVVMGGKIESWDRKWREDRKKRLVQDLEAITNGGREEG